MPDHGGLTMYPEIDREMQGPAENTSDWMDKRLKKTYDKALKKMQEMSLASVHVSPSQS